MSRIPFYLCNDICASFYLPHLWMICVQLGEERNAFNFHWLCLTRVDFWTVREFWRIHITQSIGYHTSKRNKCFSGVLAYTVMDQRFVGVPVWCTGYCELNLNPFTQHIRQDVYSNILLKKYIYVFP